MSIMEKEKILLDFYLEEYRTLSSQILQRVTHQQTILNYQLVAAGIFLSLNIVTKPGLFSLLDNFFVFCIFSCLTLIFLFFSWVNINHDLMIISTARYVNTILRKNIKILLGKDVLQFEDFLEADRVSKINKFGVLPAIGNEGNLSIFMSISICIVSFISIIYSLGNITDVFNFFKISVFSFQYILISRTVNLKIKISKEYKNISIRCIA